MLGLDIDATKTDRTDEIRRAIYTAATRARSMLIVVGDPDDAEAIGLSALASQLRGAQRGGSHQDEPGTDGELKTLSSSEPGGH